MSIIMLRCPFDRRASHGHPMHIPCTSHAHPMLVDWTAQEGGTSRVGPVVRAGPIIGGVTLPICAVIKLEWTVIKSKFGSVKKMSKYIQPISHYPPPWDVHWTGGLDRTVGLDGTVGQAWSVRVGCPMDVPWMSIGQVDWTGQWDKPGQ